MQVATYTGDIQSVVDLVAKKGLIAGSFPKYGKSTKTMTYRTGKTDHHGGWSEFIPDGGEIVVTTSYCPRGSMNYVCIGKKGNSPAFGKALTAFANACKGTINPHETGDEWWCVQLLKHCT